MRKILTTATVALALLAGASVNSAKADPLGLLGGLDTGGTSSGAIIGVDVAALATGGMFVYALADGVYKCAFTSIDCSKAQAHNVKAESDALTIHAYNVSVGKQDDVQTAYILKHGAVYGDGGSALASVK